MTSERSHRGPTGLTEAWAKEPLLQRGSVLGRAVLIARPAGPLLQASLPNDCCLQICLFFPQTLSYPSESPPQLLPLPHPSDAICGPPLSPGR